MVSTSRPDSEAEHFVFVSLENRWVRTACEPRAPGRFPARRARRPPLCCRGRHRGARVIWNVLFRATERTVRRNVARQDGHVFLRRTSLQLWLRLSTRLRKRLPSAAAGAASRGLQARGLVSVLTERCERPRRPGQSNWRRACDERAPPRTVLLCNFLCQLPFLEVCLSADDGVYHKRPFNS